MGTESTPRRCRTCSTGSTGATHRGRVTPGGTGLGLAICKAIAEKAGGSIVLTSQRNQGTTATVRMPVAVRGTGGGAMKIILGIVFLVVICASAFADYKWRAWMAARKRERE
jgi:hypothetical protein